MIDLIATSLPRTLLVRSECFSVESRNVISFRLVLAAERDFCMWLQFQGEDTKDVDVDVDMTEAELFPRAV